MIGSFSKHNKARDFPLIHLSWVKLASVGGGSVVEENCIISLRVQGFEEIKRGI